jgi:uncharacterized protein DUF1259
MLTKRPTPGIRSARGAEAVRALGLLLLIAAAPAPARAQADTATWNAVGRLLKSPPAPAAGYVRYNFPRRDISLTVGDVAVAPALALGAWAGFAGSADSAVTMGDLVLVASELSAVQKELAAQGLEVTAIHNHLAGETPPITYLHFHGEGPALRLAQAVDKVLARTAVPRPVAAAAPQPVTIDTAMVWRVLGIRGRATGAVAQLGPVLVPGIVTMGGHTLVPAMAYGTPINLQLVKPDRMVAAGDFAVLGERVGPLIAALVAHGITAEAMHSHLIGEAPRIYYIHFWGDGKPEEILAGLRAALNSVNGQQ